MTNAVNIETPAKLTPEQECQITVRRVPASELATLTIDGPVLIGWHGPESFKLETVTTARNNRFGATLYQTNGDAFEWSMPSDWTVKVVATIDDELAAELAA